MRRGSIIDQLRTTRELYGKKAAKRELKQQVKLGYLKESTARGYARRLGIPYKKRKKRSV